MLLWGMSIEACGKYFYFRLNSPKNIPNIIVEFFELSQYFTVENCVRIRTGHLYLTCRELFAIRFDSPFIPMMIL